METKRIIQRSNETKEWFFEIMNNISKPLAKQTTRKRETYINRNGDEKVTITTTNEI
jgi:hypothetical protein